MKAEDGKPYGFGKVYQYGNEVKYYINKNNSNKISYESNVKSGDSNKTAFKDIGKNSNISDSESVTVKSTYYYYDIGIVENNPRKEKVIFGEYDSEGGWYPTHYWLASPYVDAYEGDVYWGLRIVDDREVIHYSLWNSYNGAYRPSNGVRPVVSLKSDIKLKAGNSDNTWDFDTSAN